MPPWCQSRKGKLGRHRAAPLRSWPLGWRSGRVATEPYPPPRPSFIIGPSNGAGNAPASQPLRINACGAAIFLHEPPRGVAVQVTSFHATSVRLHGPEKRPFLVLGDARSRDVGQDRPRGVEQDFAPLTTVHHDMPTRMLYFSYETIQNHTGGTEIMARNRTSYNPTHYNTWGTPGSTQDGHRVPPIQPTIIPGGHQAQRRIVPGPHRVPHKVATRPCRRPLPQRTSSIAFLEPSPQPWMPGARVHIHLMRGLSLVMVSRSSWPTDKNLGARSQWQVITKIGEGRAQWLTSGTILRTVPGALLPT